MAQRGRSLADKTFPWWQNGFDLEGIVGFLALWLLGILLGMLWGPLFWLAFIPGLVVLFATRTADRVTPVEPSMVFAPCDGVVVSVEDADPPVELRLPGPCKRIRISTSPFSSNNIHAPIEGVVDHVIREEGAPEAVIAMKPDSAGLEVLYIALSGDMEAIGLRVAAGGLGPRLDTRCDAGDRVAAGKTLATRRLGGWCDVFVPAGGSSLVVPGRTLIGGESALWRLSADAVRDHVDHAASFGSEPVTPAAPAAATMAAAAQTVEEEVVVEDEDLVEDEDITPETVPPEVVEEVEAETVADEYEDEVITPETVPPEVADDVEDDVADETEEPKDTSDPSEMFARLRREARKLSGEDET